MKRKTVTQTVESFFLADPDRIISNNEVYLHVANTLNLTPEQVNETAPIGEKQIPRNLFHRTVRWAIAELKNGNILMQSKRGQWTVTHDKKKELHANKATQGIIAMSTELGICLCGDSEQLFSKVVDEPIHLLLTSPPYPLKISRAYGNVQVKEWVQWLVRMVKPIVNKLADGGSIVLNVSNDIFIEGTPARSTYWHRLIIALEDELELYKMDLSPWISNKIPGPTYWASINRFQLNTGWEPVIWMSNNPLKCFSNNQRVLEHHSKEHLAFMANGGLKTAAVHGDGAYRKKRGAFSNQTKGKIPRNHRTVSNYCHSGRGVNQYAKELGLPTHAAKMPAELARFWIEFLTEPDMTVVDNFGGTLTTSAESERLGRRWITTEQIWSYITTGFHRFIDFPSTWINPRFAEHYQAPT
ncbi:DNA methyltransferase [Vibrio splendidus]